MEFKFAHRFVRMYNMVLLACEALEPFESMMELFKVKPTCITLHALTGRSHFRRGLIQQKEILILYGDQN